MIEEATKPAPSTIETALASQQSALGTLSEELQLLEDKCQPFYNGREASVTETTSSEPGESKIRTCIEQNTGSIRALLIRVRDLTDRIDL